MMRFFLTIILSSMLFFSLSGLNGNPQIKSKVTFKKNLSESEISGWENQFFKDFETEFAQKAEQVDNEKADEDFEKQRTEMKKDVVRTEKKMSTPVVIRKKRIISEKVDPFADQGEPFEEEVAQQPEKTAKNKRHVVRESSEQESLKAEEIDDSDNEVDRSGQIRKMKELLKKRKGKNRIEDRRIY